MYKRDITVWICNSTMYKTFDMHVTECMMRLAIKYKNKDMIIA
jgi:hypothetical protein